MLLFKGINTEQLQSTIAAIQEINNTPLDVGSIVTGDDRLAEQALLTESYASAVRDLEPAQAALLLSTQGLTNGQILNTLAVRELTVAEQYQAMADAGLLKSKATLTAVEIQETLQTILGADADAEATLASIGLSTATDAEGNRVVKLTARKIQAAVASGKLTTAQAQELAMHFGVAASLNAQSASVLPKWIATMKAATLAIWGQVRATAAWLATTPAGWATGILGAAGLVAFAASKVAKSMEEARKATEEAAIAFKDSSTEISNYADKYKTLHDELVNANTTEERQYEIKRELLDLQKELNSKYGEECGKLDLVTNAYVDQSKAIRELNKEKAKNLLNQNRDGIEKADRKMNEPKNYVLSNDISENFEESADLKDIIEKYSAKGLKAAPGNLSNTFSIEINANAEDAYDTINAFMNDITDLNNSDKYGGENSILDNILSFSTDSLNEADKILNKYQETYNQALLSEIAASDDLSKKYQSAIAAANDYNEAIVSGDEGAIKNARTNLDNVRNSLDLDSESMQKFGRTFNDVLDQADTRAYDFSQKLQAGEFKDLVGNIEGKTHTELEAAADADNESDPFVALMKHADEYGVSVEEVIAQLTKMGVLQSELGEVDAKPMVRSLTETIAVLDTMSDKFSTIDKLYKEFKDEDTGKLTVGEFSNEGMNSFIESFKDIEGVNIDGFLATLSSSKSTAEDVQNAFDGLAQQYIESSGCLEGLTNATAEQVARELESIGVKNAAQIVSQALANEEANLAAQKYYAANASFDLANATVSEMSAFINEAVSAGVSRGAIIDLMMAKISCNENGIVTDGDINNLIELANAAGIAQEAVANAKSAASQANKPGVVRSAGAENAINSNIYDNLSSGISQDVNPQKYKYTPITYSGGKATNSGKGGGSKGGGSKGSGGGAGGAAKEPTEFDWMEQKVTNLDSQVDKLKNNIETLVGYKNKNSMTNTAVDVLIEKMDILQQMHDKYMEKANGLGLNQEYIDKIQNGTIEIESIGDENLATKIKEYQDLFTKAQDVNDKILENKNAIHELNLSKLDNVIDQFEKMTDVQSQIIDTEKQLLELRENSGESIYSDDYISLAEKQMDLTRKNADAYNRLSAEMDKLNLKEGSEEWKEYNDQLQEYKNNMISAADAVEDYKDAMTELIYKDLNDFKDAMDSINGSISTMNKLIGDTDLVDETGKLTDRGLTQVALYAHQLTNSKQEAAEYAEAIKSLDDALDSGLITQDEYNSKLHEYTSAQESAVQSSKDAKDAILSLVKEGIQAEIDAKKKLVDETKAALDAEKDLHDYQNSISEKQDNISKLERQIASLGNSTDRSDLAKKLELQSQLADAKKDLYQTQYDHEIEQRKEALDDEYSAFEESKNDEMDELDSNLDAQEKAINKYLEYVKANYSTVYDVLTQYGDEYSLSTIKDLTDPWDSGKDAANLCSDAISDVTSNIQYDIDNLDFSPLYELVDLLNTIGMSNYGSNGKINYEDISGTGSWQKGQGGKWWYGSSNEDYASDGIYTINGQQYGFDSSGYMKTGWDDSFGKWHYFEPENGQMVKSEWRTDKSGDYYYLDKDGKMATDMAVKAKNEDGYYYLNDDGKWDGKLLSYKDVKDADYRVGYKNGTTNASKGLHRFDEDGIGSEVIITKNGLLRQFDGGETVFNSKLTERLYELANDPSVLLNGIRFGDFTNIPKFEVKREPTVSINSPLVQIDGSGLSASEVTAIIKNETRDIDKRVANSIKYDLMGK